MEGRISTKRKKVSNRRGRFKLVVFFIDHRLDKGFTMFSKVGQDVRGVSLERFQHLVLRGTFAGKVKWAGIYERGQEVWNTSLS